MYLNLAFALFSPISYKEDRNRHVFIIINYLDMMTHLLRICLRIFSTAELDDFWVAFSPNGMEQEKSEQNQVWFLFKSFLLLFPFLKKKALSQLLLVDTAVPEQGEQVFIFTVTNTLLDFSIMNSFFIYFKEGKLASTEEEVLTHKSVMIHNIHFVIEHTE